MEKIKQFPDNYFDICFTSPPYNRKRNDKYLNYDDTIKDYYNFLYNFIESYKNKISKYIFLNVQTNYYNKKDVYRLIGTYYNYIQQIFIWNKTNPLPASGYNITNSYEFFIVFGEKSLKSNSTYTKNIIETSVNSEFTTKIHKAVMKQEVSDWFIKNFSLENDLIVDPFMGLGTTGISCKKFNRDFIGIELDSEYFNIAKERINNAQTEKRKDTRRY